MPVITTERITGLAHCAQQVAGVRCDGWEQEEVDAVAETIAFLYGDSGPSTDPIDASFASLVDHSSTRFLFADPADAPCPHCGQPRELSDQLRPVYTRLSEQPPDELLRRQRVAESAVVAQVDAATRQAVALETLAASAERAGETEQLREVVAQQQDQINRLLARLDTEPANGHSKRKRAEG